MLTERVEDIQKTTPATLLIVEDDHDIQAVLEQLLGLAGYNTVSVASGNEAREFLRDRTVDLVLLDVMLPDVSGYDLCEELRQEGSARTPIVMLTALAQQQNIVQGLRAGADDYIRKPFLPDELILRIQRLIERQKELASTEHEADHLRTMLDHIEQQLQASQNETAVEATLRRDLLHNVTTHMQALSGIAEATVRKLSPSPERDAVQQLKSRIRGAALVYEIAEAMQHDPVEVGGVIQTITMALKSMYRPWKRIQINISAPSEPIALPLTIASPLAMIVNEAVTNCFKHAFPDNRFGKIDVGYGIHDDVFTLTITDDGVGFDIEETAVEHGRPTVLQLVEAMQGKADWSSGSSGTRLEIAIPIAL